VSGAFYYDDEANVLTFDPDVDLTLTTTYTATLSGSVRDQAGNLLGDDYSWSFTALDIEPPQVVSTDPEDGATGVGVNAMVSAVFSEVVITHTLAFTLTGPHGPVPGLVSYDSLSFVFYPDNVLKYDTAYTATVAAGLEDTAGNATAGDYVWRFATQQDAEPPQVISTNPEDGATGVDVNATVSATFNEPIDAGTLSLTLAGPDGPVAAGVSYNPAARTATLDPDNVLKYDTLYTATVAAGLEDVAGNATTGDYVWHFATQLDTEPPWLVSTDPEDGAIGVGVNATVSATFNEAIDAGTLNLTLAGPDGPVAAGVSYNPAAWTATLDPDNVLKYDTLYTATVAAGLEDMAGNAMAGDYVWHFATQLDTEPPWVISTDPEDGATGVDVNATVSATFNEAVDAGTLSLTLAGPAGPITGSVSYDPAARTATLDPDLVLDFETPYTATVAGTVTDLAGNPMGSDYVWNFTTAPEGSPPVAAFTASNYYPALREGVAFTNQSSGSEPLAFRWNFGDGEISQEINPTHAYAAPGTYLVTLTVSNPWGEDTATAAIAVSGWQEIGVPYRIEITGIGMGDRDTAINPQTLSLAGAAEVDWLLAQVAGSSSITQPELVTLTTDAPQSLTLSEPTTETPYGYTFEAALQPAGQITASVNYPGDAYKTPRGLVLYARRAAMGKWTSVGRTVNQFVYSGSGEYAHTEVLTFPPLERATDLYVTAVVIDNNDDDRPMVVEAAAGGVTESVTELGPTDGAGLNVVELRLPRVLTGTSQVSVTLRSPAEHGDSLTLVGLNVSYSCAGAILHVFPSPATVTLGTTVSLTVSVTPGPVQVNGVQVHGRLDPAYLRLVDVRPTGVLPVELDPVAFDPVTGEFHYGAELASGVITRPFGVLVLEVEALATTGGTLIEFLDGFPPADVSGPEGSVMSQAQDGLVIVPPAPTLRGTVDMQGRPARPDPSWVVPLTVWLTPAGGGMPVYTATTTTDLYGEFGIPLEGIPPGLYDIRVKGNHTLRNLAPGVSLVAGDNAYSFGTLLEGDTETAATFNRVVLEDAGVLISSFNRCRGNSGFVANADLDENGCVSLSDFSLLAGNYGLEGDVIVPATPALPDASLQASGSGALIAFNAEEMTVAVGEVVTLMLDVDPRDEPVNSVMAHLNFDPAIVEVVDVALTGALPVSLDVDGPLVDNLQGVVRFGAGALVQTLTEKFSVATLSLRVKSATAGTTIIFSDAFPPTDVMGPEAKSVLAEAKGITLKTETQEQTEYFFYLPIVGR